MPFAYWCSRGSFLLYHLQEILVSIVEYQFLFLYLVKYSIKLCMLPSLPLFCIVFALAFVYNSPKMNQNLRFFFLFFFFPSFFLVCHPLLFVILVLLWRLKIIEKIG